MTKFLRKNGLSLLTILLITTLSLMPGHEFPQVNVQFADKWAHWVMYGFLTIVMCAEFLYHNKKCCSITSCIQRSTLLAIISAIYGGLMELGQAYLTTTRHGDWLDVWANSFGSLCGYALVLIFCFKKNN